MNLDGLLRIIGISPDYSIHIRQDVLKEEDGPMLVHGLQRLQGRTIVLPRRKQAYPDQRLLEMKFQRFKDVYMRNDVGSGN